MRGVKNLIHGDRVKWLREKHQMTQEYLAEQMRVPLNQLREIEENQREMSPKFFARLVEVLEMNDDDISSWKHIAVGATGNKVRALRKNKGLNLEELGALTGLSPTYISEVERGEKVASISALRAITEVFEVPISLFIGNKRKQSVVGQKLRNARVNRGITQKELAEITGLSTAMITHLENGKVQASLDSIEKISESLGISICYLILEQEEVEEMIGAITPEMREILFDKNVQNVIGSICTFSKEEMIQVLNYVHLIKNPFIKS